VPRHGTPPRSGMPRGTWPHNPPRIARLRFFSLTSCRNRRVGGTSQGVRSAEEVCVVAKQPLVRILQALSIVAALPAVSFAGACDGRGVADVLARARAECCPARNHGAYVSCAAHV